MPSPNTCTIVASIAIEGAAVPGAGFYLCGVSGAQPIVCTAGIAVNTALQSPAVRATAHAAAGRGCQVVIEGSREINRFIVTKGAETADDVREAMKSARDLYREANTHAGLKRLMQVLATQ